MIKVCRFFFILLVLCAFILSVADSDSDKATRIFLGGKIWTADPAKPWAEAIAIKGSKILAVGSDSQIRSLAGESTELVSLKGRFVSPGFNDAHLHFLVRDQVEIEESDSIETILKHTLEYAAEHPASTWITGHGWGYATFPQNRPHRRYLDAKISERAVLLYERDGHMALANTKALQLAGVTSKTPDPEHGRIVHDEKGELTGELQESAMDLVSSKIAPPSEQELYESLKRLLDRAASYGLTSVQNASFDQNDMPAFDRVLAEDGLKVRFSWAVPFKSDVTAADFGAYRKLTTQYPPHLMKFAAAKGLLDGVVDAQTAAMFEPYTTGKNGILMWKQEDLFRTAELYDREGYQILLHAIGDKAISLALDAYAHVAKVNGKHERRHRVEHAEVPRKQDLARFQQLGVIASTQALFANPDKTTLENYAPLIGPERASRANAFKKFDDANIIQAFGSDWPVFSMETLRGIYAAVTRTTPQGTPKGGWHPENNISPEAALRHFTTDAAFASFDENIKGSLTPGKYADFVVLSENILEPPADRILKALVLLTVMGGKDTFRSPDFQ